jgi:hypothetical protein
MWRHCSRVAKNCSGTEDLQMFSGAFDAAMFCYQSDVEWRQTAHGALGDAAALCQYVVTLRGAQLHVIWFTA